MCVDFLIFSCHYDLQLYRFFVWKYVEVYVICFAVCQNNCSGHGQCDPATKRCVCSGFWMENFFLANFGERQSNCGNLVIMLRY